MMGIKEEHFHFMCKSSAKEWIMFQGEHHDMLEHNCCNEKHMVVVGVC